MAARSLFLILFRIVCIRLNLRGRLYLNLASCVIEMFKVIVFLFEVKISELLDNRLNLVCLDCPVLYNCS